jgi:hypothetical protein
MRQIVPFPRKHFSQRLQLGGSDEFILGQKGKVKTGGAGITLDLIR